MIFGLAWLVATASRPHLVLLSFPLPTVPLLILILVEETAGGDASGTRPEGQDQHGAGKSEFSDSDVILV